MRKVSLHTLGKVLGLDAFCSQHPLDDVAVMAKQSPRLAGVMAVIRAHLPAFERNIADRALVALNEGKPLDFVPAEAGSPLLLGLNPTAPRLRVFFDPCVYLGALRLLSRASGGLGVWSRILCCSGGFDMRERGVFALLRAKFLVLLCPSLPVISEVRFPLLLGAVRFLLASLLGLHRHNQSHHQITPRVV